MQYSRRTSFRLAFGAAAALLVHQASPAAAAPPRHGLGAQPTGAQPGPRRDHSLTADPDRGRLYLFGGRSAGRPLDDLWEFDPATAAWDQLVSDVSGPDARFGHNAVYDPVGGQLIVAFGQAGSTFFDDIWAFRSATGTWTRLGEQSLAKPAARYGSAAAFDALEHRVLVTHGFTASGRFDDTWAFDVAADRWTSIATTGPAPIKRCLARAAFDASTGQLVMFGGQSDSAPFLGDLWSLNLAGGRWTELAADGMPVARHFYAATSGADGVWHMLGGNSAAGPSSEHWTYSPAQNGWQLGAPIAARYSHDAAILGDSLYMFGGTDGTSEHDDVWSLSLVE